MFELYKSSKEVQSVVASQRYAIAHGELSNGKVKGGNLICYRYDESNWQPNNYIESYTTTKVALLGVSGYYTKQVGYRVLIPIKNILFSYEIADNYGDISSGGGEEEILALPGKYKFQKVTNWHKE